MVLHNAAVTGSLIYNGVDISSVTGSSVSINALNAFSSSMLSYTSSNDAKISSLNTFSSSLLSYTASNSANVSSLFASVSLLSAGSASSAASINALNTQTASLLSYTASNNTSIAGLNSYTSSNTMNVVTLFAASASLNSRANALESATSSLYTYTSSLNARTSSFATTGSNTFSGSQTITGSLNVSSNITTPGTITAQTLVIQTVTSSIVYSSGSNIFGNSLANTQIMTGSVNITGSLIVTTTSPELTVGATGVTLGNVIGDVHNVTGSLRVSGSSNHILGNVGIGTTSPSFQLDLGGGTTVNTRLRLQRGSDDANQYGVYGWNQINLYRANVSTGSAQTDFSINQVGSDGSRTPFYISSGGQVGIGTTSPSSLYSLTLNGNSSSTLGGIVLRQSGTDTFYLGNPAVTNTTDIELWNPRNGYMRFATNNSEAMRITSGGNVGIGTTSPTARLTVSGTQVETHISNGDTNTLTLGGFSGGRHFIKSINLGIALTPLTLQASSFTFDTGNVGIGTTSPTGRLNVITSGTGFTPSATGPIGGSQNTRAHFQGGEPGIMLSSDISPTTGGQTGTQAYQLGLQIGFYAVNDVRNQIYYGNGPLTFVYSGNQGVSVSEYMRITSGGNVGIGTTSPQRPLHVNGTEGVARFTSTASGNDGFEVGIGTSSQAFLWQTENAEMQFATNNTERMRITSGGNVGIGTTSPASKLHIDNTTGSDILRLSATNVNTRYVYTITGGATDPFTLRRNHINDGDLNIMTWDYNGRVGIGTTSPNDLLHINGSGIIKMQIQGSTEAQLRLNSNYGQITNVSGDLYFTIESASGNQIFRTGSSTERMRITSGGNVGIGTTSPSTLKVTIENNGGNLRLRHTTTRYRADFVMNTTELGINSYDDVATSYMPIIIEGSRISLLQGNVGIGTTSPVGELHIVNASGTGQPVLELQQQNAGSNILQWRGSAGSYLGVITNDGNVGIGITSPAALLDVRSANTSGATGATIRVGSQNHGGSGDEFANLEFFWGDPDYAEVKAKIYTKNTGNVGPGGGGAADLLFATRPAFGSLTERMRITSGGKVGVNNTSPNNFFDIFSGGPGQSNSVAGLALRSQGGGTFITGRIVARETSNTTETIATFSATNPNNERIFVKVQVVNVSAVNDYGNVHVGYALWSKTGTKSVTTMTLDSGNSNISNANVGTLSWSGDNLQYTTNGAGNYELNAITIFGSARDTGLIS